MATLYDVLMPLYGRVHIALDTTLQQCPMRLADQYQADIKYHYLLQEQICHYGMLSP